MLKPYDLLDGVLNEIEKGLKEGVNEYTLADKFYLSKAHLRRLFRFAFGRPIGAYIRSRKLAASVEDLLLTDMNVLDIAVEFGLDYEQTFIRAFKREFGLTPGELRKTGHILKITPPLQLFDSNRMGDGVLIGPEIVIIPQFHVIGKRRNMPLRDNTSLVLNTMDNFMVNERTRIPNAINPDVLINISSPAEMNADYCYFMPSNQVKSLDKIPEGFDGYTFPASLCARFCSIESDDADWRITPFKNIDKALVDRMFKAIDDFTNSENHKYFLDRNGITIDRFDPTNYNGNYKLWEWFSPVTAKTNLF